MKRAIFLKLFYFIAFLSGQTTPELSEGESSLYNLIMEARENHNLSSIPLSESLTQVAVLHLKDLNENEPYDDNRCNPHSWSDKGSWEPCCYDSNHSNPECMWKKPIELTEYTGFGYEVIAFQSSQDDPSSEISPQKALELWMQSPGHKNVLLNLKHFKDTEWRAIGVAIQGPWACVWFGEELDE